MNKLLEEGVAQVLVIDDGNGAEYLALFQQLAELEGCTVLTHPENRGKGAGLKTGFRYFSNHLPDLSGIVTADADDQHLIKDVLNVGDHLANRKAGVVLGTRNFGGENIPARSLIGNRFTSLLIKVLFGLYIPDTQTGLRGIVTEELPWLMELAGDHFDYEMKMLIRLIKQKKDIIIVEIETVYEEEHISSYDTYADTVRIAKHILGEIFR